MKSFFERDKVFFALWLGENIFAFRFDPLDIHRERMKGRGERMSTETKRNGIPAGLVKIILISFILLFSLVFLKNNRGEKMIKLIKFLNLISKKRECNYYPFTGWRKVERQVCIEGNANNITLNLNVAGSTTSIKKEMLNPP